MTRLNLRFAAFLMILGLLFSDRVVSQSQTVNNNGLALPSANNNFLNRESTSSPVSVSVDQYTGTAVANVPIYTLASRETAIPISLNYVGGRGIRLQDCASSVGLGWQLNAGGSITRVVRAFPDEGSSGYVGGGWGNVINGWTGWSTTPSLGNITPAQLTAIAGLSTGMPTADGEPDIFNISTPFFSAQFVWDGNGTPVFSNATDLSITYFVSGSFVVKDGQGNLYYFGSTANSVEKMTTNIFGTTPPAFTTCWYLDKIVTFNSRDVINLSYLSAPGNSVNSHYQWTEISNYSTQYVFDSTAITSTISTPKYVSAISTSLGEVDFSYVLDRLDDVNAERLSRMVVKAYNPQTGTNSTILQSFTFNTSYFGSPSTDHDILRLRLDNITVTGNSTATSAPLLFETFGYNQNKIMPTRRSQAFDYWGYSNNSTTAGYFTNPKDFWLSTGTALRNPDINYGATYVLNSIQDVNGGKTILDYELNNCILAGAATVIGGLRVKTIKKQLPTLETYTTSYFYDANGNGTGASTGQVYGDYYKRLVFGFGTTIAVLSECPFVSNDINGNYVGYSTVRKVNPNGGYTITTFSNFNDPGCSDFQNQSLTGSGTLSNPVVFISSTSAGYKRGLILDQIDYSSTGAKISEDFTPFTSYSTLTTPTTTKSKAFRIYYINGDVNGSGGSQRGFGTYYTVVENYRLTKKTHRDYDQKDPSKYMETVENYTYSSNNRLIYTASKTDSKGLSYTQTYYRAYDSYYSIPLMTANEGTAQTLLNTAGKTDAVLHVTTSRNGAVTQTHNSYSSLTDGTNNHAFLTAATQYVNTNIATTTQYNNNVQTAGVIGSQVLGGQNNSVQYGYNGSSYPVAVVKNASSVATMVPATITTSGTLDDFSSDYFNFTIVGTGNYATFSLSFQNSPVYGNHTTDAYTITGPSPQSGTLCYSLGGTACPTGPPSNTVTYVLPAGSYSFHGNGSTTDPTSLPNVSYTYTSQGYVASNVNEFFLENFEENTSAVTGTAHTGNRYLNGNFTPPFNPSVSRKYLIQYWTLVSGKWNFTQASYSYPMTITGPVDDVRIFPVDALMTSYTYAPLVGKTSEIDPTGNTVYYEYDGLGRPSRTRDLNGFITKKYCYNNYLGASSCPATSNINNTYNNSNTTWTATLTNVLTGTVYTYSIPNTLHPVNNLVIPVGNYNLSMSPGNGVTHVVGFDGYTMSGIGAAAFSLTNIPISNDVIFNITN